MEMTAHQTAMMEAMDKQIAFSWVKNKTVQKGVYVKNISQVTYAKYPL
jgi:hypothetical protein